MPVLFELPAFGPNGSERFMETDDKSKSMPGIYLSDEEMEALIGAPALAQRLYIMGIRPSMSFKTGMVGVETKVSWHGLARELRVEAARGIKEELPSKEQVRRAAQHLVKRGLIIEKSEGVRLIFHCLLARVSPSVQIKADTNPTGLETRKPTGLDDGQDYDLNRIFEADHDKADTEADIPNSRKPTHIRGSEIYTPPLTRTSRDVFPMQIGWKPSENFAERLNLIGINPETIPAEQRQLLVGEFVSYWMGQPGRAYRQSEWDHKLIQHITGAMRSGRKSASANAQVTAPDKAQKRAAVSASLMNIDDTDW